MGDDDNKKKDGKGFAGLTSLGPDVDRTASAPKDDSVGTVASAIPSAPQSAQPQPSPLPSPPAPSAPPPPPTQPPSRGQVHQEPAHPPDGESSVGKWVLGIGAVVVVFWLLNRPNDSTVSPATTYSPPAQSAAPDVSAHGSPQPPARPQEARPPEGQNLVLSSAQIRYCVAEEVRMNGAESILNNNNRLDVDRFNTLVADYNNRCSQFRYRQGALESAKREIDQYQAQLFMDGKSRFASSPQPTSSQPEHWAVAESESASTRSASHSAATPPPYSPTTHFQPPSRSSTSAPTNQGYDSENQRALERLAQAREEESRKRAEAQQVSSTPGAQKRWDYKTGRDIWVDAYGNPIN